MLAPGGGGINLNLNFFTDDNIPGLSSSEDEEDDTESSESVKFNSSNSYEKYSKAMMSVAEIYSLLRNFFASD